MTPRGAAVLGVLAIATTLTGCAPSSGTVTDRSHTPAWTEWTEECSTSTHRPGQGLPVTITERCSPVRVEHRERYRLHLDNGHDSGWRTVTRDEYRACPPPHSHYPGCTLTGETR